MPLDVAVESVNRVGLRQIRGVSTSSRRPQAMSLPRFSNFSFMRMAACVVQIVATAHNRNSCLT